MWIEKQGGQEGRGRKADAKHPVHPSPRNASILANLPRLRTCQCFVGQSISLVVVCLSCTKDADTTA
jgi:hypothetical protein